VNKFFRKIFGKLVEGIIFLSGTFTTLLILMIIIFLFGEAVTMFNETPLEEGYVIAVNQKNTIEEINASQLKNIFDQKISDWHELGGTQSPIVLFRIDDIDKYFTEDELGSNFEHVPQKISDLVANTPGIIAFLPKKQLTKNFQGRIMPLKKITLWGFLSGKEWFPTAQPAAQLGVFPLILGTLLVSLGAILIALPLGLATAIYMAEIANDKMRRILKPLIELLAGIPSVIYGFFGLVILVPAIRNVFGLPVGETALAGSIVLGIMALPTIITITEDALRTTPRVMKEASLALGANKWQTIHRVVLPYAGSGIIAAAILGIGRAIGETMAVLMVTGNAAVIPHSFLVPVRTIPATIAAELGEAPHGGLHFKALFVLAGILFIITMLVNLSVGFISMRRKY
jgi:phosphate transport system permease protein